VNNDAHIDTSAEKPEWIVPEVTRLQAGAAESQRGGTADGGGGFQGS